MAVSPLITIGFGVTDGGPLSLMMGILSSQSALDAAMAAAAAAAAGTPIRVGGRSARRQDISYGRFTIRAALLTVNQKEV